MKRTEGLPMVLFVDDNADTLQLVKTIARKRGTYNAETASNATDAIERINHHKHCYDAIVTDFNLPDLTGIGLISHIRRHNLRVPVAVMTAHVDDDIDALVLAAGARLIRKDLNVPGHIEAIEALIEGRNPRFTDGEVLPEKPLHSVPHGETCAPIVVHPSLQKSMHEALERSAESVA